MIFSLGIWYYWERGIGNGELGTGNGELSVCRLPVRRACAVARQAGARTQTGAGTGYKSTIINHQSSIQRDNLVLDRVLD